MLTLAALTLLLGSAAFAADSAPSIQVHGYLQNRIYAASGANPEFRTDRISVSTTANLQDKSTAYVEVYYLPYAATSGLYLESGYYDTMVGQGHLRIGKGRNLSFGITPCYSNRKTSNYGLFAEAFTQDRIQGVQYYNTLGTLDIAAGLYTGLRLGNKGLGEVPGDDINNPTHSVAHLAFRDTPGGYSKNLQASARVGSKWLDGALKIGVSQSYAKLDPRDMTALNSTLLPTNPFTGAASTTPIGATFTSDTLRMLGFDLTYTKPSGFVMEGEWVKANISDLDCSGYYILFGWQPPKGWNFYARYGAQLMGITPTDNPLTWDVKQISLSAVQPIRKGIWLQYEYEINTEVTNTGDNIKNNLLFVELFSGF